MLRGLTTVISQAFQSAVTRNHLNVALPAGSAVQRQGHGYVQQLQDATSGSKINYLVTKSDNAANAYVVSGAILARYQQLGGVTGSLGFPIADATAGGTQTFENSAALSGNPTLWFRARSSPSGPPLPMLVAGPSAGEAVRSAPSAPMRACSFQERRDLRRLERRRSGQAYCEWPDSGPLQRHRRSRRQLRHARQRRVRPGSTHRQNFEGGISTSWRRWRKRMQPRRSPRSRRRSRCWPGRGCTWRSPASRPAPPFASPSPAARLYRHHGQRRIRLMCTP